MKNNAKCIFHYNIRKMDLSLQHSSMPMEKCLYVLFCIVLSFTLGNTMKYINIFNLFCVLVVYMYAVQKIK